MITRHHHHHHHHPLTPHLLPLGAEGPHHPQVEVDPLAVLPRLAMVSLIMALKGGLIWVGE